MSAQAYKAEEDIDIVVTSAHVKAAKCADPTHCTLALASNEVIGSEVQCVLEDETGKVRATWKTPSSTPGKVRFHRAYLEETWQAVRILMLTDQNKQKLVKKMPKEGISLRIADHQSRSVDESYKLTEEQKEAKKRRQRELNEKRAQGLEPPPARRNFNRPRATNKGLRGVTEPSKE